MSTPADPLDIPGRVPFEPPPGMKAHPALDRAIPMMTDDEFARLVWSIKKSGLLDPISIDRDGVILDGRCRLMACQAAGVEPRFRTIETDDPLAFICDMNLGRVHRTPDEVAMSDALLAAGFPDFPVKPMPEAMFVLKFEDLMKQVLKGDLDLGSAYERAIEREKEEALQAVKAHRLNELRKASGYLALQVDNEAMTLDEGEAALAQAVADAEERAAAPALAEHAEAIRVIGKRMVADIVEIGRRLCECKRLLGHGNWLPWLEREFGWKENTALNFMRVHEMGKSANFADLNVPISGLYLLARPSTPEDVRADVLRRAEAGEAFSVDDIKQAIGQVRGASSAGPPGRSPDLTALRDLAERMSEARPDDAFVAELRRILRGGAA